jgi:hypothetical protein
MIASSHQTDRTSTIRVAGRPLVFGAILVAAFTSTASIAAEPKPKTRVVSCEAGSCLLVTGHRASAASEVSINGYAVPVEGKRNWRVRVPVDTVREWSAPLARTITVSVTDAEDRAHAEADLPIGLLGHAEDLALLVVSIK